MNAWIDGLVSNLLNYADPNFSQIVVAKKSLQALLENSPDKQIIELYLSACDGDLVTLENLLRQHSSYINQLYPSDDKGCSMLIFAICFDQLQVVELLLDNKADVDLNDTILYYTPLMWAVYFNQLDVVKLLLDRQADPYKSPKDGKTCISLLNHENTEMWEFFKSHNLLNDTSDNVGGIYGGEILRQNVYQDDIDDLSNKIKLQTVGINYQEEEQDQEQEEDAFYEETELSKDHILVQLKEFDYEKILVNEYIKFNDSDIPQLLDFIFNLRSKKTNHQHDAKIPAAIVFQLIRYAHLKVNSDELTNFTFDCFVIRLRSVTNTKSGVFNMIIQDDPNSIGGAGDIVLLSYWLSVIQFLHFYFCKNQIYNLFPEFLQELINVIQSLVSTLSFSINSRLNLLVDDCLLNFTNLVDVSNVLYAKDWNLFKSKPKIHSNTFDDIHDMLYPPSQKDLMKPSPLKYIQTLGALDYVLGLHQVDSLLRNQCFSQVFYYIDSILFNKIIASSKYCTRSKAIQIRLNISTVEDWLRSRNYKTYKPEVIGNLASLAPGYEVYNLLNDNPNDDKKDAHNLTFYYNSIYIIGKTQLQPTIELLQFLQCMSLLLDEESFINTINQFDYLNYYQLLKITKTYKYEVDEPKLHKTLINLLKRLITEQGENQLSGLSLEYMTQNKLLLKEVNIYINPNYVFKVTLPNLEELVNNYGSGLGGIRTLRAKKYQPSLPIDVLDDIDEVLVKNTNLNDTFNYEEHAPQETNTSTSEHFQGDALFKQVQVPTTLAHRNWGEEDIESNPW